MMMSWINIMQYSLTNIYFGDLVYSLEGHGLSNKHLKIAVDFWYPWLYWKCANDDQRWELYPH